VYDARLFNAANPGVLLLEVASAGRAVGLSLPAVVGWAAGLGEPTTDVDTGKAAPQVSLRVHLRVGEDNDRLELQASRFDGAAGLARVGVVTGVDVQVMVALDEAA
jgi:hypothetical protein